MFKSTDTTPLPRPMLDTAVLPMGYTLTVSSNTTYPFLFVKSQLVTTMMAQSQVSETSDTQIKIQPKVKGSEVLSV